MPTLNIPRNGQILFDQMESFGGGCDMYRRATLLQPDQYQNGVNIVVRDNLEARTRVGADALGGVLVANAPIRGMLYYDTPSLQLLLTVCGGNVRKWDTNNWNTIAGWTPANSGLSVEMAQGVDKVLITDGSGNMQSFDGTSFTDLGNTNTDPPQGATLVRWHAGRMFAAGHPTYTDTVWVSNLLNFASGQWNATTQSFRIGDGDGEPIIGMFSLSGVSSYAASVGSASTGSFTIAIMKSSSIWLTNTDPTQPPSNWSTSQPVASLTKGIGLAGKHAGCTWGNDLYFVGRDRQIYSLQRMVAAGGQYEVSAPLSQPMQPIIDRINPNAQSGIEVIKYREFILFCVPLDSSSFNNTVMVYNARLQKWMGIWTGWSPVALSVTRFLGVERLVIGDHSGYVNQWKDFTDERSDNTYKDNGAIYPSQIDTRSTQFGEPLNRKSGRNMKARFTAGHATVTISAVMDLAASRTLNTKLSPSGDLLGVGVLGTFKLASQIPIVETRGLRNLRRFNEMYVSVKSESGWFWMRSVSLAAFLCSFKDNSI